MFWEIVLDTGKQITVPSIFHHDFPDLNWPGSCKQDLSQIWPTRYAKVAPSTKPEGNQAEDSKFLKLASLYLYLILSLRLW